MSLTWEIACNHIPHPDAGLSCHLIEDSVNAQRVGLVFRDFVKRLFLTLLRLRPLLDDRGFGYGNFSK